MLAPAIGLAMHPHRVHGGQHQAAREAIGAYYADVTTAYRRYAQGTNGWHHGIWDAGVASQPEALLQASRRLVRGLTLTPEMHILDVGCGDGGFAVWLATQFGCRVTGITICAPHIPQARALAAQHGVEQLCRFVMMDLATLALADDTFDLVTNHESFCYAPDPAGYLAQVRRVLKPGGVWRALEGMLSPGLRSVQAEHWYRAVCEGWYLPGLTTAEQVGAHLGHLGYTECEIEDISQQTAPTAHSILGNCWLVVALSRVRLEGLAFRLIFPLQPRQRRNHRGHYRAGIAFSRGLLAGWFRYYFYSARKATQRRLLGPGRPST